MDQGRRSISLITFAVMVMSVLFLPGVKSPVRASSYVYACNTYGNYKAYVSRDTAIDYIGVIGDMRAEAPGTCTGSVDPVASYILPANLQYGISGQYIVQTGLIVCSGSSSAKCGDSVTGVPSDGQLHFVYMCSDVSGGEPCLADGWVGHAPEIGQRYRFRIEKSGGNWLYSIKKLPNVWTATTTIARSAAFSAGDVAWWAAETYDPNSQLGTGQSAGSMMQMYWMQYLRTSVSGWQVTTDNAIYVALPSGRSWPTYWLGYPYDQNYTDDAINIYTTLH